MKKKFFKYLAVVGTALCLSMCFTVAPITAINVEAAMPDTAGTNQEYIGWVYLKNGGKLYKRLFNYSTGLWIGEWIYVRELRLEEIE